MRAFRFHVALNRPLVLKGKSYSSREGILLEEDGQWAEASPLPGFSSETIDDVISALRGQQPNPSSLQFALASLKDPIATALEIPWNFLLLGDRERVLADVKRCIGAECGAAKLKVGRGELEHDVQLVKEVRGHLPAHVSLRLDANRAWTFEEATQFIESLDGVDLEYIEEPLQEPRRLEDLFAQTGIKYALDETLAEKDCIDAWPNATALICKPTIVGGRETVERLAATGKSIVFSAAFESGVGIARIAQLAAEISPQTAAGVDTLDWLTDDLLSNSAQKQGNLFRVPGSPIVDATKLEVVEL